MDISKPTFQTIDEYIHSAPKEVKKSLEEVRQVIKEEIPGATEAISYQMPTFKLLGKNVVHFAAWKRHIGFYPTPSGTETFKKELSKYHVAKGSIQFPLDQSLPLLLIRKIVQFRVKEILEKAKK